MEPQLDPAIMRALPQGSIIISTTPHGKTNWAQGLKVEVEVELSSPGGDNGTRKAYFLKITNRERANEMALGEFESQKALHTWIPENSAEPLAFGPLETSVANSTARAFFMTEFRDLDSQARPSPSELAKILVKLHTSSVSPQPGKFGFPVTTFRGYVPTENTWTASWETWFTRQFRQDIAFEQSIRGPDPEMNGNGNRSSSLSLLEEFCARVIPRLLRPLQTGGRQIKPSFVHTDIWYGNIQLDRDRGGTPILFDACGVYGHHEMELGMFHHARYKWTPDYLKAYTDLMPPSEPKEDFDDRLSLYAMRNYIVSAGLWDHWAHMRGFVKEEMKRLLAKHSDGYAGFVEGN